MREWLHELASTEHVKQQLPGGIHAFSSFKDVPKEKPFLVHRLGAATPTVKDDNRTLASRTNGQLWVHDHPTGDYLRIDRVLDDLRKLLEAAPSNPTNQLVQAIWVETSDDLLDPEMQTILKYGRFTLVHLS